MMSRASSDPWRKQKDEIDFGSGSFKGRPGKSSGPSFGLSSRLKPSQVSISLWGRNAVKLQEQRGNTLAWILVA